ncbi:citrate/2-methylcitrate synthase, partial [Streptomyces tanashiensis]
MSDFVPGLEGVVAFETEIAEPDKEGGALRYRGVDIEDLVGHSRPATSPSARARPPAPAAPA